MMTLISLPGAMLTAAVLTGSAQDATVPATVATAGTIRVTTADVIDVLAEARRGGDLQRLAQSLSVEGLERFAREALERKILAAEARSAGLDRDARTSRAIERSVDAILADALLDRTRASVDTSEGALRRFFAANPDAFRSAPRRKARHLVVASREEADRALAEIRNGAAFSAVAARVNTDSTRGSGGALGWVARGVMIKTFEAALFALEQGAVSEPLQTAFGWHLATVEEIDPGTLPPFELIRDRVLDALREEAVTRLKDRLWGGHSTVIDRTVLATLLK